MLVPNCFKNWCISETKGILLAWCPIVCLPPSVGIFLRVQLVLTLSPTFWRHLWKARRSRFWKDKDSFSGKLTKLYFYSESFYAWEQGKAYKNQGYTDGAWARTKLITASLPSLMRHIDSIFSGSKDNLFSSRPACYSQHYSYAVVKAVYAGNVSQGKTSETCLEALALRHFLVRTFSSRQSRSFPQHFLLFFFSVRTATIICIPVAWVLEDLIQRHWKLITPMHIMRIIRTYVIIWEDENQDQGSSDEKEEVNAS